MLYSCLKEACGQLGVGLFSQASASLPHEAALQFLCQEGFYVHLPVPALSIGVEELLLRRV